jgi:hypothetical protein
MKSIQTCDDLVPKWHYSMDTEACEEYLGCEGVKGNNFDSEEECKQKCVGPAVDCSPVMCMMYCPYGFKADEKGCAVCKCYNPCEVNTN